MKITKQTFSIIIVVLVASIYKVNAQWSLTGNANATATSFIGTLATNPAAGQDITFKRAGVTAGKLQATTTSFGVNSFATPNSVAIGTGAGQFTSGLGNNTYIGQNAGKGTSNTTLNSGKENTFIGLSSGSNNVTGNYNTYVGGITGMNNLSGSFNIAIGYGAGVNINYNRNIFIGNGTGNEDGSNGDDNIFIGNGAGYTETQGNRLIIDNVGETDNPIIWGDMLNDRLKFHAKVGISPGGGYTDSFGNFPTTAGGVNVSSYNLFVKGGILAEEIRVALASTWADYVFEKNYQLKPIAEVEKYIKQEGHLPNMPSAKDVALQGINVAEMTKMQQEKIEELTLYIIEQNKINENQNKEIQELKAQIKQLLNKK